MTMLQTFAASLRVTVASLALCVGGYTAVVWAFAQSTSGFTANGSILMDGNGRAVGSRQIAQAFTGDGYFWPRPSAADYDGTGAAGSNLSPAGPDMRVRGEEMVARYGATPENPLPADLAAASGGGLDPHISEAGALYQIDRIAEARGVAAGPLRDMVESRAYAPGGVLTKDRIVNVLDLNMALDRM